MVIMRPDYQARKESVYLPSFDQKNFFIKTMDGTTLQIAQLQHVGKRAKTGA